jgi:hypothetical protein
MKEQKRIIFVVLFLVGLSVFSFSDDPKGSGSGKSLKITGIDPKYGGIRNVNLSNTAAFDGSIPGSIGVYNFHGDETSINAGNITMRLHVYLENSFWNGSGSYFVIVGLTYSGGYTDWYVSKNKISFENAITEIAFANNFNFLRRSEPQ